MRYPSSGAKMMVVGIPDGMPDKPVSPGPIVTSAATLPSCRSAEVGNLKQINAICGW